MSPQQLASQLWALCDVLRDEGITYHQYINELSYLLFLKMAEESGTESVLPPDCRWRPLVAAPEGEQFNRYMHILLELGTTGPGVVRQIFANPTSLLRKPRTLRALVTGIDSLEWHDTTREGLGDIYETLLSYSAEKRSGAGQYFTPRPLIESIVEVIKPGPGQVLQDPALGTGGFLVAAHQYLRANAMQSASYVGVELVPDNFRLALMNLFIHGMQGSFHLEDSLSEFAITLPKADVVLTNPPFGTSRGAGGPTRTDLPYPTSNKQLAFLQHIVGCMNPDGRAAVVVPDNVLFEQGAGRAVRGWMMDACDLHTILRLPTGIFYAPGIQTNVLFLRKGRTTEDRTERVWIYDLRSGVGPFGRRKPLVRSHFADFEHRFGNPWRGEADLREDTGDRGRFRCFSREWIASKDDSLSISWLADAATEELALDPEELLAAAIGELEGACEDLRGVIDELGGEP